MKKAELIAAIAAEAGLTKKDLPRGHWRPLTEQEVINLGMIK